MLALAHLRLALAVALISCSCAGPEPEIGQRGDSILGGQPRPQSDGSVALMLGDSPFCSGVLISPHVVLTAAHCIPGADLEEFQVYFGWDVSEPGVSIEVAATRIHPSWSESANDLGLIALAEPAPDSPVPLATSSRVSEFSAGDQIWLVGFGRDQSGRPGTKNESLAQIEAIGDSSIELVPLPGITCDGDSGGPLLAPTATGDREIVGIHSRSNCIDTAYEERVDVHISDFIQPFVSEREAAPICDGCPSPARITGGCSTSQTPTLWSSALLLAFVLLGRSRSKSYRVGRSDSSNTANSRGHRVGRSPAMYGDVAHNPKE